MSFDKFNYLKEMRGMPVSPRIVLVEIFNHTNSEGENAFPGIETLIKECALSRSTVKRNLRWLEDHGWITQKSRGGRSGDGRTWASVYVLCHGTIPGKEEKAAEMPADESNALIYTKPLKNANGTVEGHSGCSTLAPESVCAVPNCGRYVDASDEVYGKRYCIDHFFDAAAVGPSEIVADADVCRYENCVKPAIHDSFLCEDHEKQRCETSWGVPTWDDSPATRLETVGVN